MKKHLAIYLFILAWAVLWAGRAWGEEGNDFPYLKERVPWIALPSEAFVHGDKGIYFMTGGIGDSDYENFLKAIEAFRWRFLVKNVQIILNSGGGQVYSGFAIADAMLEAQTQGMTFEVRGYGLVGSAAVIVFAAGTIGKRYLSPLASIFLHEFSLTKFFDISSTTKQRRETEFLEMGEKVYRQILTSRSKLTDSQLRDMMRIETWLSPTEAVQLGIADGLTR